MEETTTTTPTQDTDELLNKGTIYYNNLKIAKSYKFDTFNIAKELEDRKNFSMTITAKRMTGKSVLLKDLCSQIKDWYSEVYVFSMTCDLQPDLFDFVKKENIINHFDEPMIQQLWNKQEQIVLSLQKTKTKDSDIPRILIIFDDLISDPKVKNSEILKRLYVAGRHVKISQIFLTQTFTGIPPVMRTNVDVAISFYLDSWDNREAYAKQYLSTKNKNLGIMIFEQITKEQFNAIVVLNFITTQDPQKSIKMFKARLRVPKFKMGKQQKLKHSVNFKELSPASEGFGTDFLPRISRGGIKL